MDYENIKNLFFIATGNVLLEDDYRKEPAKYKKILDDFEAECKNWKKNNKLETLKYKVETIEKLGMNGFSSKHSAEFAREHVLADKIWQTAQNDTVSLLQKFAGEQDKNVDKFFDNPEVQKLMQNVYGKNAEQRIEQLKSSSTHLDDVLENNDFKNDVSAYLLTTDKFKLLAATASRVASGSTQSPFSGTLKNGEIEISPHAYDILKLASSSVGRENVIDNKQRNDIANGARDRYGQRNYGQ